MGTNLPSVSIQRMGLMLARLPMIAALFEATTTHEVVEIIDEEIGSAVLELEP